MRLTIFSSALSDGAKYLKSGAGAAFDFAAAFRAKHFTPTPVHTSGIILGFWGLPQARPR
jgi:hypothetical protein